MKAFWKWFGAVLAVFFFGFALAQSAQEKAALKRKACGEVAAKTPIKDLAKAVQEQKAAYARCIKGAR